MNSDPAADRPSDDERAALEPLLLDGCHALDAHRAHPCPTCLDELRAAQRALLAAVSGAGDQLCDDLLGLAAELKQELAAATRPVQLPSRQLSDHRGAA